MIRGNNTLIVQGNIATHDRNPFLGQVVIDTKTGLITKVSEGIDGNLSSHGEHSLIFPGMGDVHIHAREDETEEQNYKESYTTATRAALNGGVTHVSAMPNTPSPVTSLERFNWHRRKILELSNISPVSVFNYIGIEVRGRPVGSPGEHMYKLYGGHSVGNLGFNSREEVEQTLANYKGHHISFHVEDQGVLEASKNGKTHQERRPREAPLVQLRYLLPLIERYGIKAKLCHWNVGNESFELIEQSRQKGASIDLEVSPMHLLFDADMARNDPELWLKVQMNPAIQSQQDRLDLIEGLQEGKIQYIATDHAPHTLEEKYSAFKKYEDKFPDRSLIEIAQTIKQRNIDEFHTTCCENNMSGSPWLDNYAHVVGHLMSQHNFTAQDIARVTGYNPGRFVNQFLGSQYEGMNFGKGFGKIEKGYMGNLTIIDTQKNITISNRNCKTKVGWTPMEGIEVRGGLERIIIRGKDVTLK